MNGLWGVDIDIDDAALAKRVAGVIEHHLGATPCVRSRPTSARLALLYRCDEPDAAYSSLSGNSGGVEFMTGPGHKLTSFGRHHKGGRIQWLTGVPGNVHRDSLPVVTSAQVAVLIDALATSGVLGKAKRSGSRAKTALTPAELLASTPGDVARALADLPNEGASRQDWVKIGMAAFAASGGSDDALVAWIAWSNRHPAYPADDEPCAEKWASFQDEPPNRIGWAWLLKRAEKETAFKETDWRVHKMAAVAERKRKKLAAIRETLANPITLGI
jgi:hypothetical protein